jgi:DNA-directed RNA polymerase I, II, and III subunit RPABC2
LYQQDENYDVLGQEQEGEGGAEGEETQANGVGATEDQPMANGEEAATNVAVTGERQPNKVRVTTPYLTKYERARILGTRALQIRLFKFHRYSCFFTYTDHKQHECTCSGPIRW